MDDDLIIERKRFERVRGFARRVASGTYNLLATVGDSLLDRPRPAAYAFLVVLGVIFPAVATFLLTALFCANHRRGA